MLKIQGGVRTVKYQTANVNLPAVLLLKPGHFHLITSSGYPTATAANIKEHCSWSSELWFELP